MDIPSRWSLRSASPKIPTATTAQPAKRLASRTWPNSDITTANGSALGIATVDGYGPGALATHQRSWSLCVRLLGHISHHIGWALYSFRKTLPAAREWRCPSIQDLHRAAAYAAINVTATGPAELDKTLALKLSPPTTVGIYAAGARVIGAATLPVLALMLSATPRLFREGASAPLRHGSFSAEYSLPRRLMESLPATALWICAPMFAWLFGSKCIGL